MSKARGGKAKTEAETAEREMAWAEAKDKDKSEIYRLANEARERA